jgi:hypothetical protein
MFLSLPPSSFAADLPASWMSGSGGMFAPGGLGGCQGLLERSLLAPTPGLEYPRIAHRYAKKRDERLSELAEKIGENIFSAWFNPG